jgi:adenylate cyclase
MRQPSFPRQETPGTVSSGNAPSAPSSVGLDEEMLADENEAAASRDAAKRERRLLGRPRPKDKEPQKKGKPFSEIWDPESTDTNTFKKANGGAQAEVSLALDTNFDHIDDIVDTSIRHASLVGPMDERLSPEASHANLPSMSSSISKSWSNVLDRSTSVTFVEKSRPQLFHTDSSLQQSKRPLLHRMGSSGMALADASLNSSPERPTTHLLPFAGGSNLKKINRSEAQSMLIQQHRAGRRSDISPGDVSQATVSPGRDYLLGEANIQPFSDTFSVASESPTVARDHRKASYASSSSRMTAESGISPTTSLSNLPKSTRDRSAEPSGDTPTKEYPWHPGRRNGEDLIDGDYSFPARKVAEGHRKSSASSYQVASAAWAAPDSWAVQPGELRDALRDDDEDDERMEEETSPETVQIGLSSSSSSLKGINNQSGSLSSSAIVQSGLTESQRDVLSERRGTIDSTMSTSSAGAPAVTTTNFDAGRNDSEDSTLEVLAAPSPTSLSPAQAHGAGHSSNHRPTSRGSIGGTTSTGGKSLLNRPSRLKLNIRPNTAGSISGSGLAAFGRPAGSGLGTPNIELEGFNFGNGNNGSTKGKRPNTAAAQTAGGKMTYLRIYRSNDTHTVVSIPLTSTAAELRALLARKVHDGPATKRLFVLDKGSERPLGESEKPAILQRRRFEQAGYIDSDGLDEIGREDMSFLLKFVYRPDSVTKLDSHAFGNTETDFNRLDLQNKNLEMVPIFLYRHAEWIQSLDLSGNPMSDLPLDFIQSCNNLSTLRLSHLALKRIPKSIRYAEKLTHLDVSDNRIPELFHINLDEITQLMSLKVQNNRLSELPAYFAAMSNLRDINISNNRFEVFPSVICQITSLHQLDISFNTITELPADLGNLVNLQRLVLVGNMIVKLPSCIGKLVNLQAIDVRRNLLQDVSELFTLPRLQVLQCEHNSIKNLSARFGVHLRKLEIGHNPLSKAVFTASDICALTSLNLSSANMGKLDDDVLSHLPNLTELILDKNTLVVLPDNLGDLSQLQKLSCSNNLLATLPESLGHLTQLKELQVHNNNLKSLPASIWMCPKLHTINVSSNLLESFPEPSMSTPVYEASGTNTVAATPTAAFASSQLTESRKGSASSLGLSTLTVPGGHSPRDGTLPLSHCLIRLRLGDNRLTEDIFDVLNHLTNLKVLNLSCNEIYELPSYGLSMHVKLEELYLSGNSLNSIPADVLPLLQELRILHLNGNKLQTLPAELGKVMKLVKLDVGNNSLKYNISNQQYDWNWNSNPNLRYLNLSGNKRLEIKSNPVMVGSDDQERHRWKRTDSSDFQRLPNLRLLGLMDVTVTLHQMPDQFEDRRVRTSLSQINQMAYGISDALGQHDHLSIIDVVIPRFRKMENESMFGIFAGRGHSKQSGSRIAFHLAEWVQFRIQWEVRRLLQTAGHLTSPEPDQVADILRRAFLRMEKEYADVLIAEGTRKKSEAIMSLKDDRDTDANAAADSNQAAVGWRSGACAVLAYIINRTLYIANVGDCLAVLCRNSQAVLASTKHEPFDRNETLRIRSAEGWVSLQGQVNDKLDVSRSFGHYHLAHVVNAAPAVTQIDLTDSDEFVILANRTLWDFIPYQTAVDIARMERDDPMLAAQKLRDFAISYGAEDSIMVMVVAVGDLFEKSRNNPRNGTTPYSTSTLHPYGQNNEPSSAAYENDIFKKIAPRRAREDRDLPGDRTLARLQREVAPPIGQVALVFTDIKNSTALWETNGGMQSAMRLHNFLLRRQLRNIGGYEVKTEGDAFMVSFQNVTSALLWCFQVQIHLLKENWPQELLESEEGREVYDDETGEVLHRGLSVRMGIHWGWPVCEADPITRRMDYFGPMVNRASRISGAADGGQILASKDVVSELRAIMGTFEDDKNRGLINEAVEDHDDAMEGNVDEEEALRLLHPNVSRDVILLRRMGFAISDIGERRLKGLETPEFISLVYPKSLTRRHLKRLQVIESSPSTAIAKAEEEANQADPLVKASIAPTTHEVFEPTIQLLNIDEIRALGFICLRLEALAQGAVFKGIEDIVEGDSSRPLVIGDQQQPRNSLVAATSTSRQMLMESYINRHPELSMYAIRDDATDNELHTVLKQLTGRIWVVLSNLALRKAILKGGQTGEDGDSLGLGIDIMALVDMLNLQSLS